MATIEQDSKHDDFEDLDDEVVAVAERFAGKHKELEVDKLFRALVKLEGSDLHMKVGRPPMVRVQLQCMSGGLSCHGGRSSVSSGCSSVATAIPGISSASRIAPTNVLRLGSGATSTRR